jgi:hypothetical protein
MINGTDALVDFLYANPKQEMTPGESVAQIREMCICVNVAYLKVFHPVNVSESDVKHILPFLQCANIPPSTTSLSGLTLRFLSINAVSLLAPFNLSLKPSCGIWYHTKAMNVFVGLIGLRE